MVLSSSLPINFTEWGLHHSHCAKQSYNTNHPTTIVILITLTHPRNSIEIVSLAPLTHPFFFYCGEFYFIFWYYDFYTYIFKFINIITHFTINFINRIYPSCVNVLPLETHSIATAILAACHLLNLRNSLLNTKVHCSWHPLHILILISSEHVMS